MNSLGVKNMIDIISGCDYLYIPSNENEVKELLIGHSIKKVKDNTLELDNGIELQIIANDGCICGAGEYEITELNDCKNIITNIEFEDEILDDTCGEGHSYKIFVYAEDKKVKLLQCDGDDGNGWYGTGYHIRVRCKDE